MATSEPKNKTEKNKISITKKNSKAVTNWYRQKKKILNFMRLIKEECCHIIKREKPS